VPAKPTEDDQHRAAEVVGWEPINHPELQRALAGRVAQALAGEREQARAPFLAVAAQLEMATGLDYATRFRAADLIRAAAQEDPK
jgi:hypothetical protein